MKKETGFLARCKHKLAYSLNGLMKDKLCVLKRSALGLSRANCLPVVDRFWENEYPNMFVIPFACRWRPFLFDPNTPVARERRFEG